MPVSVNEIESVKGRFSRRKRKRKHLPFPLQQRVVARGLLVVALWRQRLGAEVRCDYVCRADIVCSAGRQYRMGGSFFRGVYRSNKQHDTTKYRKRESLSFVIAWHLMYTNCSIWG
jgi:hypothetical protein